MEHPVTDNFALSESGPVNRVHNSIHLPLTEGISDGPRVANRRYNVSVELSNSTETLSPDLTGRRRLIPILSGRVSFRLIVSDRQSP